MSTDIDWPALRSAAERAARLAYAPYSRFRVGAALLCEDGTIVVGCNVENASYGLTICAERNAVHAAVAQGHTRFIALAIATEGQDPVSPCGACRQVLAEFAPSFPVHAYCAGLDVLRESTASLLPYAFSKQDLR
jgi:cytidine deaminase